MSATASEILKRLDVAKAYMSINDTISRDKRQYVLSEIDRASESIRLAMKNKGMSKKSEQKSTPFEIDYDNIAGDDPSDLANKLFASIAKLIDKVTSKVEFVEVEKKVIDYSNDEKLAAENERLRQDLLAIKAKDLPEAKRLLLEKTQEYRELEVKYQALQAEHTGCSKEIERINNIMAELRGQIIAKKKEISALAGQIKRIRSEHADELKNMRDNYLTITDVLNQRIHELQAKIRTKAKEASEDKNADEPPGLIYPDGLAKAKVEYTRKLEAITKRHAEELTKLEKQLAEKSVTITSQTETLSNRGAKIAELETKIAELNGRLGNFDAELAGMDGLRANIRQLTGQNGQLSQQNRELGQLVSDLTARNEQLTQQNSGLSGQLRDLESGSRDMEQQNYERGAENDALRRQLADQRTTLEGQLATLRTEQAAAASEHHRALEAATGVIAQLNERLRKIAAEHASELDRLRNELTDGYDRQISTIKAQHDEIVSQKTNEIAALQAAAEDKQLEYKESLTKLDNEHKDAIEALNRDHAAVQAAADNKYNKLQREYQILAESKQSIDQNNPELQARHASEIERLRSEMAQLRAESQAMSEKHADELLAKEAGYRRALDKLRNSIITNELPADDDELRTQLANEREAHQQELARLQAEMRTKEDAYVGSMAALKTEHEGIQALLTRLQNQSPDARGDKLKAEYERRITDAHAAIRRLEDEKAQWQDWNSATIKQLRDTITSEFDGKIRDLEKQIEQSKNAAEENDRTVTRLNNELRAAKQQIDQLQTTQAPELQQKLSATVRRQNELNDVISQLKGIVESMSSELRALDTHIETIMKQRLTGVSPDRVINEMDIGIRKMTNVIKEIVSIKDDPDIADVDTVINEIKNKDRSSAGDLKINILNIFREVLFYRRALVQRNDQLYNPDQIAAIEEITKQAEVAIDRLTNLGLTALGRIKPMSGRKQTDDEKKENAEFDDLMTLADDVLGNSKPDNDHYVQFIDSANKRGRILSRQFTELIPKIPLGKSSDEYIQAAWQRLFERQSAEYKTHAVSEIAKQYRSTNYNELSFEKAYLQDSELRARFDADVKAKIDEWIGEDYLSIFVFTYKLEHPDTNPTVEQLQVESTKLRDVTERQKVNLTTQDFKAALSVLDKEDEDNGLVTDEVKVDGPHPSTEDFQKQLDDLDAEDKKNGILGGAEADVHGKHIRKIRSAIDTAVAKLGGWGKRLGGAVLGGGWGSGKKGGTSHLGKTYYSGKRTGGHDPAFAAATMTVGFMGSVMYWGLAALLVFIILVIIYYLGNEIYRMQIRPKDEYYCDVYDEGFRVRY